MIDRLAAPDDRTWRALEPAVASLLGALLSPTVDWTFAVLFLLVAVGYGLVLSLAALAVEEFSFHRYRRPRDLMTAFAAAVAENLGHRQLTALWPVRGIRDAVRGGKATWGEMTRVGFGTTPDHGAGAVGPAPLTGSISGAAEVWTDAARR
ncbi:hypothetical protein ACVGVM_08945 [Pseudonocardia bannensis]|uniref:hypothetical protein n=1 Tax=Pseudonocardia bannensis TaxID=630973 RepID=UPI001B7CEEB9|nr:hypothetical protein [Pseudonocardia bannensis]